MGVSYCDKLGSYCDKPHSYGKEVLQQSDELERDHREPPFTTFYTRTRGPGSRVSRPRVRETDERDGVPKLWQNWTKENGFPGGLSYSSSLEFLKLDRFEVVIPSG